MLIRHQNSFDWLTGAVTFKTYLADYLQDQEIFHLADRAGPLDDQETCNKSEPTAYSFPNDIYDN